MFLFTKHFWKIGISHLHHHSYNLDTVTGAMSTRHAAPWRSRFCFFGTVIAQGTVEQWLLNPCWWMITGEKYRDIWKIYGKSWKIPGFNGVSGKLIID